MIFKTEKSHFSEICRRILENGSYEVPEILQTPIEQASQSYLDWMTQEIAFNGSIQYPQR